MPPVTSLILLLARTGLALMFLFVATVTMLHVLEREYHPAWRTISEYALGRYGWMMRAAFWCLGLTIALAGTVLRLHTTRMNGLGLAVFGIAALGAVGAGLFNTDPITPPATQTTTGMLHNVFSVLLILGLPIAVALASPRPGSPILADLLPWASRAVWAGCLAFVGAGVWFGARGRSGAAAQIGWPQRFMVFTYTVWLVLIMGSMALTAGEHGIL